MKKIYILVLLLVYQLSFSADKDNDNPGADSARELARNLTGIGICTGNMCIAGAGVAVGTGVVIWHGYRYFCPDEEQKAKSEILQCEKEEAIACRNLIRAHENFIECIKNHRKSRIGNMGIPELCENEALDLIVRGEGAKVEMVAAYLKNNNS